MKNVLFATALFLFFLLPVVCEAQSSSFISKKETKPEKRWMIAMTFGRTLNSPGKDLEQAMKASSFGDRTPLVRVTEYIWFFPYEYTTGGVQYPLRDSEKKYIDIHLTYSITPKSAIGFHFGQGPAATVEGYDRRGDAGNFLTLKSASTYLSFDYILRTGLRNSGLTVGPALAFHQVAQQSYVYPQSAYHQHSVKPGFHIGYDLAVINSKDFFFGLNLNYNWFSKVRIGEISMQKSIQDKDGNYTEFASVFKPASMSLNTVNLGLTVGFKL